MGRLTERNYLSRRVGLTENLTAATAAFKDTAFRFEMGEADQAAVDAAKAEIAGLEGRLTNLDAAWERTKAEDARERGDSERLRRQSALADVAAELDRRTAAAADMQTAAQALADAWKRFNGAGDAIQQVLRPFAPAMGADGYRQLRDLFTNPFHSPNPAIGGTLTDAGLVLAANDFTAKPFRGPGAQADGIVSFASTHGALIRRAAEALNSEAA